jgi:serpin B
MRFAYHIASTSIALSALFAGGCGAADEAPGELLVSSLARDLAPSVDAETRARHSADNRDFAFELFQRLLAEGEENIFVSPHSISIALAMTYAGASGETHEQMGEVLRFTLEEDELHSAFNALDLALDARSEVEVEGDAPTLRVVNATWGQHDYPFAAEYLDTLAVHYGAGLRAVNFLENFEAVRQQINAWVEAQTQDRIRDLLPEGSLRSSTVLVLTNAIYFLAGWEKEFPESQTADRPFTRPDGSEVEAPLMRQAASFAHYAGDDTHAISLPYVGGEISLIAMMPADPDGLAAWEASLDRETFDAVVAGLQVDHGTVSLPRFRTEGDYDLKALFTAMGWTEFAELARMVEGPSALEITDILHKSFIDLDEQGTEAAAATAVVIGETSAPIETFELHFDRTFVYAIYDHPTDTILFLGRLADPSAD